MHRYNQRMFEEMKNKQNQERVRLPKIQRSEAKTRMAMFKKSIRITATAAVTPEQERERIKQVTEMVEMGLLCGPSRSLELLHNQHSTAPSVPTACRTSRRALKTPLFCKQDKSTNNS